MSLVVASMLSLTLLQAKKPATQTKKPPIAAVKKPAPTAPASPYVGQWVTIQATGVQGKQELKLIKDGTFTMTVSIPSKPDHVAKGHFTVKAELPPGTEDKRDCTLYLQLESLDGSAIAKGTMQPKKLGFYSKGPILTDTIAVVFCRPGDESKITKMFADKAKTGKGS
jgi:hypothetical protein